MSCSGIRCRNRGSGYVKEESTTTAAATELNARLATMAAERAAQDARLFPALSTQAPSLVVSSKATTGSGPTPSALPTSFSPHLLR